MAQKKMEEKRKAYSYISSGKTQKEVAQMLSISEKTISTWVRQWKVADKEKIAIIKKLENLLSVIIEDKETKSYEIMNITVAIKNMQNTLFINKKQQLNNKKNERSSTV